MSFCSIYMQNIVSIGPNTASGSCVCHNTSDYNLQEPTHKPLAAFPDKPVPMEPTYPQSKIVKNPFAPHENPKAQGWMRLNTPKDT